MKKHFREKAVVESVPSVAPGYVTAKFEDGTSLTFKEEAIEALSTDEKMDASAFRDHALKVLTEKFLKDIDGWHFQLHELHSFGNWLENHLQAKAEQASAIALGVYPSHLTRATFEQLSATLASYKKPEGTKEA
jgi:hypothetical protein